MSSGESTESTPSEADCTQRSRPAEGSAVCSHSPSARQKNNPSASAMTPGSAAPSGAYRSSTASAAASMPNGGSSAVAPSTTTTGFFTAAACR